MDDKDKKFNFKMKIFVSVLMIFIAVYLVILSCISVSASTFSLINDDMNTDEILQSIGKNPNDYNYYDKTLEDLYNDSSVDYESYFNYFSNCYDFIGIGEGLDTQGSLYVSTYLVFKTKLSYDGLAYYPSIEYANLWCGSIDNDGNACDDLKRYGVDFLLQKDITYNDDVDMYETGLSGCFMSDDNTISKGVVVYKVKMYSSSILNENHRVGIENIKMSNGSYYTLSFVQDYIKKEDGSLEVDNNMIPKYSYCQTYGDNNDKVLFVFKHSENVNVEQINIDDVYYETLKVDYDELSGKGYYTIDLNVDDYGTKTYYIKGYKFNDNYVDLDNDVSFRYVSEKTSVWVEADKKLSNGWAPIGGNFSTFSFTLHEKKSGKVIDNATRVRCKYQYKGVIYTPIQNVKDATFVNSFDYAWGVLFDGSNKDGKLIYRNDRYQWGFGIKITDENIDVLMIEYVVDNQIIVGSCYKNGLHVEYDSNGNKSVYDMNGVKCDKYSVDDNNLILKEDGSLLDTNNSKTLYDPEDDSIITKIKKYISIVICVFVFLIVFWILKALGLTQYIGKFIVWLFKMITYPFRWIINKLRD